MEELNSSQGVKFVGGLMGTHASMRLKDRKFFWGRALLHWSRATCISTGTTHGLCKKPECLVHAENDLLGNMPLVEFWVPKPHLGGWPLHDAGVSGSLGRSWVPPASAGC